LFTSSLLAARNKCQKLGEECYSHISKDINKDARFSFTRTRSHVKSYSPKNLIKILIKIFVEEQLVVCVVLRRRSKHQNSGKKSSKLQNATILHSDKLFMFTNCIRRDYN
jgi:hypothetical protein